MAKSKTKHGYWVCSICGGIFPEDLMAHTSTRWSSKLCRMIKHYSYCRKCNAEKTSNYRKLYKIKYLTQHRKHYAKNINKLRERHRVWQKVSVALKNGTLHRKPCEVCGETNVVGHHDDYSKPLEVRWLCRLHHKELHKSMLDNSLKQAHT